MSSEHTFKVVIPARYGSSRLPGKPLRTLAGKPMIAHVHARALESGADEVVIATDDARIAEAAERFGAEVCLTSATHASGTDRIAEVVKTLGWNNDTIVVNLQGDEPLMNPAFIRQVARDLAEHPDAGIATLCTPVQTAAQIFDPHVVKVVVDMAGYAIYFSRAPIPWSRDAFASSTDEIPKDSSYLRHIGLYAYRAGLLDRYTQLAPSFAERAESLEQLRALAHGIRIHVSVTEQAAAPGVDTEQDLERVAALLG